MSGNQVDELARNWPQLAALLFQMLQRIQRATADGSIRLSRADYKQFAAELADAQKVMNHEIGTTRAWYQARTEEYQRESQAAKARAAAGMPVEEQAKASAYLLGLRAGIEHTVHDSVLTPEQRGQVVQSLDRVDTDPSKPVARNVFEHTIGVSAVKARYTAAASEQKVAEHRQQLARTTTTTVQPEQAEITQWRQDNARRFDDLAGRLDRLEDCISTLHPQETATATSTSTNGHAVPHENQRARQRTGQRQEQHAEAQHTNGATAHSEATAEADADSEHPAPQKQSTAEQGQQTSAQAESTAQMQAEA
ncbi:hypothetical protein ACIP5Y_00820 [Nocardia sp. NPDC088792]|uniref:hypothetical protein n=1 Tax=Nocardia sp. NPDC088792 TaxID=3364332 RepID=UPI003827DC1C